MELGVVSKKQATRATVGILVMQLWRSDSVEAWLCVGILLLARQYGKKKLIDALID